ncbi:MAG: ATP-binding protein [Kofleriaceae bacterium]
MTSQRDDESARSPLVAESVAIHNVGDAARHPRSVALASELAEANERLILVGLAAQERADEREALLDNMAEGVIAFETTGRIVLVNQAARVLFGIADNDELTLCELRDLDDATFDLPQAVVRLACGGQLVEDAEVTARVDQVVRRLAIHMRVVRGAAARARLVLVIARDTTALCALEAERTRYTALISHDLRSPLAIATMAAHIIELSIDEPDRIRDCAARIIKHLGQMDRMIADLLDTQQLRAGKQRTTQMHAGDLATIARELVSDLSEIYGDRLALHADPTPGLWDAEQLRRALSNLITNGFKYGRANTKVTLWVKHRGDHAAIAVHNDGPPIPPEVRACLYTMYTRGSAHETTGWGIGLAVVQSVVAAHAGSITVESADGIGTTFTMSLPIHTRDHDPHDHA